MARAIWKGSISFGLVSIPVGLFSAESPDEIHFRQLDKRNLAPVGYKKYNKETGDEVSMDDIVKGYEYEDERYVLISDEDLRRANPEKTQTVDITDFVDLDEIDPEYFDKPYYLAPSSKKNMKAYALLREALKRARKVGIAKVVIRSREYLSAVIPHKDVLVLEILRYPHEIRGTGELELPGDQLDDMGVTDREVKMAEMLIDGMTAEFDPEKYKDTYRDDLMALIHRKIESGQTEVLDETPVEEPAPRGDVVDIMALLKRSVEATQTRRIAADTASNADGDEGDEEKAEKKPKRAAKSSAKSSSARKAAAKPKSAAQPAKPRARASKGA